MAAAGARGRTATPALGATQPSAQSTPWKGSAGSRRSYVSAPVASGGDDFWKSSSSAFVGQLSNQVPPTRAPGARNNDVAGTPTPKRSNRNGRASGVSFGREPPRYSYGSGTTVLESPGKQVSISGTTYMGTDLGHESQGVDPGAMIDRLAELVQATDEALEELAAEDVSHEDIDECFRHPRFLHDVYTTSSSFDNLKRLSSVGADYIPVSLVVDALPSAQRLQWKPEYIFYKANLLRLLLDVLLLGQVPDPNQGFRLVDQIDKHFPSHFLGAFQSAEERRSTFEFGLDIRTQWCLMSMRLARQNFQSSDDLKQILKMVFFNSPTFSRKQQGLRGWDMDGLRRGMQRALPVEFEDEVKDRMARISQYFSDEDNGDIDMDALDAEYPWEDFLVHLVRWVRARVDGMDEQLKSQAPMEEIVLILREELERRSSFGQRSTGSDRGEPSAAVPRQNTELALARAEESQSSKEKQAPAAEPRRQSRPSLNFNTRKSVLGLERLHRQIWERQQQQQANTSAEIADSQPEAEPTAVGEQPAAVPVQTSQREDSPHASEGPDASGSASVDDSTTDLFQDIWGEKMRQEQSAAEQQPASPRRYLTDRQAGAARISPIDEFGRSASSGPRADAATTSTSIQRSGNIQSPRKRTADEAYADDGDDDRLIGSDGEEDIEVQASPIQPSARKRRRVEEAGRQPEGGPPAATMTKEVPQVVIDNRDFTTAPGPSAADGDRAESSRTRTEQTVVTIDASDVRQGRPKTSRRRLPPSLQGPAVGEARVEHPTTASARSPQRSQNRRSREERDAEYQPSPHEEDSESESPSSSTQPLTDDATRGAADINLPLRRPRNQARRRAPGADAPPQVRRAWSVAEEKRLIWLVGKHGGHHHVSWSWIAQKDREEPGGPKVSDRDPRPSYLQMKLKDKAHQIIVDHYRAGWPLPGNFDKIPLKTSTVTALQLDGIEVAATHSRNERNRGRDLDSD